MLSSNHDASSEFLCAVNNSSLFQCYIHQSNDDHLCIRKRSHIRFHLNIRSVCASLTQIHFIIEISRSDIRHTHTQYEMVGADWKHFWTKNRIRLDCTDGWASRVWFFRWRFLNRWTNFLWQSHLIWLQYRVFTNVHHCGGASIECPNSLWIISIFRRSTSTHKEGIDEMKPRALGRIRA